MFKEIPERKVVVFNEEATWTPQEKKASLWLCALILLLVGLPSLAVAVVSTAFNAMFAHSLGAADQEKAAWVLASLGFSLFVIGIPIARPLIRDKRPDLDRKALWLWLACLGFSITSALGFSAATRDHSASVAESTIKSRKQTEAEIARLEKDFDALPGHRPVGNIEASIERAIAASAVTAKYTGGCRRIESRREREACTPVLALREELAAAEAADRLEEKIDRMRASLKAAPATGTVSDPQAEVLDWMSARSLGADAIRRLLSVFVALLVEAGSAIGLSVAAEAFVTILRERSQTQGAQAAPQPAFDFQALPVPANDVGLDAEGSFLAWSTRCLSFSAQARVKASDAFGHYETWCAQNGATALQYLVFGRRMSDYVARNGGQVKQSNGRVYEGVRIIEPTGPKLIGGPEHA